MQKHVFLLYLFVQNSTGGYAEAVYHRSVIKSYVLTGQQLFFVLWTFLIVWLWKHSLFCGFYYSRPFLMAPFQMWGL